MGVGRKGIFLSLTAMLLVGVLFIVFAPVSQRDLAVESRVHASEIVQQVRNLETNELDIWLEYTTRQTLNSLARSVASGASFTETQIQNQFRQCVLNSDVPCGSTQLVLRTPQALLSEIEDFYAENFGYDEVSIELLNITLGTSGARAVAVEAQVNISFVDDVNRVRIERVVTRQLLVPIDGLLDPLALRQGIEQPFRFISIVAFTPQDLFEHAQQGTYVFTNSSYPGVPYFGRFEQNPSASRVDSIHFLMPPSSGIPQTSHVDFQYSADGSNPCLLSITNNALSSSENRLFLDPQFTVLYQLFDVPETGYVVQQLGECS